MFYGCWVGPGFANCGLLCRGLSCLLWCGVVWYHGAIDSIMIPWLVDKPIQDFAVDVVGLFIDIFKPGNLLLA